jgi:hypothetical protein
LRLYAPLSSGSMKARLYEGSIKALLRLYEGPINALLRLCEGSIEAL